MGETPHLSASCCPLGDLLACRPCESSRLLHFVDGLYICFVLWWQTRKSSRDNLVEEKVCRTCFHLSKHDTTWSLCLNSDLCGGLTRVRRRAALEPGSQAERKKREFSS